MTRLQGLVIKALIPMTITILALTSLHLTGVLHKGCLEREILLSTALTNQQILNVEQGKRHELARDLLVEDIIDQEAELAAMLNFMLSQEEIQSYRDEYQ